MGMYDTIEVHYPLDGASRLPIKCQTKDFDLLMDEYEIRENGELWKRHVEREWVDDPNAPPFKGHMREVSSEWRREDHTGGISVYDEIDGVWHEWAVWIVHGVVKDHVRLAPVEEDPK